VQRAAPACDIGKDRRLEIRRLRDDVGGNALNILLQVGVRIGFVDHGISLYSLEVGSGCDARYGFQAGSSYWLRPSSCFPS
jgi:hypothetical protein